MGHAECSISERRDGDGDGDGAPKLCSAKPTIHAAADRCDGKIDRLKCELQFMPNSSCNSLHLNTLVQEYLELSCSPHCRAPSFHIDDSVDHEKRCLHELQAVVDGMAHDRHTGLRKEVLRACRKARAACSKFTRPFVSKHEQLQSSVLKHLRDMGLDAGICTSKRSEPAAMPRDLSSQFYPEEYVYMDVVMAQTAAGKDEGLQTCEGERVLIDLRFRSGFEIARPSPAYVDLLRVVPMHYVGTAGVLHKIIKLLSDAMKRSLAGQGMPLPPWRTLAFQKSKWLSPHRRLHLPCSPEQDKDSTSSASSKGSSKASSEFLLHLPAAIAKPVLTDRNAMPPAALRAPKSCAAHRPSAEEKLTTSTPSWLLPPLSQHCNFSKKPRKLVGALTLELQHASLAGSAKSTPIASLRFRI